MMMDLLRFMWLDVRLLQRYKLFMVSAVITLIYWLVFTGLRNLHAPESLLVLVLYSDPVLLGLLFGGLLLILDRGQATLMAVALLPVRTSYYFLSKLIFLPVFCAALAFVTWWLIAGLPSHPVLFAVNMLLTTSLFTAIGLILAWKQDNFLQFMLPGIFIMILLSVPLAGFYGIIDPRWVYWMPLGASMDMLRQGEAVYPLWADVVLLLLYTVSSWIILFRKVQSQSWS
jgi:fluoroquinolone transport system permease protein